MNTKIINWKDFFITNDLMIKKIKESGQTFDYILVPACGGLIPAYYVAKEFNLPVKTINITSYKKSKQVELKLWSEDKELAITEKDNVLLVDDIYDSGKTVDFIMQKFPNIVTTCSYARYDNHGLDFVGTVLGHETFVDFPWEIKLDGENHHGSVG